MGLKSILIYVRNILLLEEKKEVRKTVADNPNHEGTDHRGKEEDDHYKLIITFYRLILLHNLDI
jgi:hypothetical protein